MRLLLTGATGFIGRRVIARLAADAGVELVAASRTRPADWPADRAHRAVDLLAPGAPAALVAEVRPTHLLHLAWNATPGRFWTDPDNLDWSAATLSLFTAFAAHGGTRAVMAGSCAEYSWTGAPVLRESDAPAPATLYGIAKDATRRQVCALGERAGVPVAWGRVFWLYGPEEAAGRLVSDVAGALARGEPVETSEGRQMRDFLHVDDVAGAFVSALSSGWHGAFNIGSGRAVPVRDVVEGLAAAAGRDDLVRFGARPSPPGDPPRLEADTRILRDEIGFSPQIELRDGLAQTFAWWRDQLVGDARPAPGARLADLFFGHVGNAIDKWEQYISAYERELAPRRAAGAPLRVLEIGVQNGGSLELWHDYLPAGSDIVGIDVDPRVAALDFGDRRIRVAVADATQAAALRTAVGDARFDLIIDDGSHRCADVRATFEHLFDRLAHGGLYVIEDLHCSYYPDYGGGLGAPGSSIAFLERLIDGLNADHIGADAPADARAEAARWNRQVARVTFYDSMAVVEKLAADKERPYRRLLSGTETTVQPFANWVFDQPPQMLHALLFGHAAAKQFEIAFLGRVREEQARNAAARADLAKAASRAARALSRMVKAADRMAPGDAGAGSRLTQAEQRKIAAAQSEQIAALRRAVELAKTALAAMAKAG